MNSDANYSRATFLLDRTYRQRLKIVAVRVNKTEAYLVNLAIFNLLAEFEDPD
jgi:predicted DNA-binding protein